MKKIKKKKLLVFFSFVILTLSLVPTGITASNGYDIVLETGSQVLEVEYFNPLLWDNIISTNFTPSDWFEGNSDCVGAQSKYTNLWKHGFNEITHTIFNTLFFSWYNIPYLDVLKQNGYDYDYIDINYPDTYDIVQVYNRYWAFRNQPFNDFPYDRIKESIVFLNLTDISKSLTNYNNFALVVNNDSVIQALDVNLPIINMDEFLWRYLVDCTVIPLPVSSYLEEMILILDTENITVNHNRIKFNRTGIGPYITEISFTELGKIEIVEIYNSVGTSILKIASYLPKITLFITLGFSCGSIIIIITVYFLKRRTHRKII